MAGPLLWVLGGLISRFSRALGSLLASEHRVGLLEG
jgi:hypothetical protein